MIQYENHRGNKKMSKKFLSQNEDTNTNELSSLKTKYDDFNKQYGFRNSVYPFS